MSKLWGGRFRGGADRGFARFNASLPFDRRLLEADVRTASAHAEALKRCGALEGDEAERIREALEQLLEECRRDPGLLDQAVAEGVEDIHSFVEGQLALRVGELGLKLNAGRSRNDQIATDVRLYLRDAIDRILDGIKSVQAALLDLAESHPGAAIPGYTHLQKAQPLLWAHYLLAYFEMLQRDRQRLTQTRTRVNVCPLGSAALAGSSRPLDRHLQARLLGFESITRNSLDGVSDRDFLIEFSGDAAMLMMHLSRLAEDFIVYSSCEFGFLEFSDAVSTGSSLLPQKKNPDALELIRGKCARVYASHVALLTLLKGLPTAYNKDLQEDKEPVFDAVDTVESCLAASELVLRETSLRLPQVEAAVGGGYLNATELAEYLASKGLPFRTAHDLTGRIVLLAIESGRRLEELSLEELREQSDLFEEDVFEAISLRATLESKSLPGGTAPARVAEALRQARSSLQG